MTHAIALTRSSSTYAGFDTEREHVSLAVDDSSGGKRPKRFAIAAAILALGTTAFVVADPLGSRSGQSVEPLVEAPVAAGDLAPGSMYHVVDQIGARALWEQGITGAGVNVAVIDTGVAPVESLSGDGKIVAVADLSAEAASPSIAFVDGNGHGTHLAAIIAGREPGASPADSAAHPETFLGVAPDSGIVSVKVADRVGDARQVDVIAGIDWVIANAVDLDIRVINLAFDSGSPLDHTTDALSAAVERAWNAGITVVVAAGNNGDEVVGLASPANNPFVIAVGGALTGDELGVADWSAVGDGVRNPDVIAPGVSIESARVGGSDADVNHRSTGYVDDETFKGTGSSQSSAVTAGLVALLLDANPDWTPDQVKAALSRSATPIPNTDVTASGAGLVDAVAALGANVSRAVQDFAPAVQPTGVRPVLAVENLAPGASWAGASWAGASWAGASWAGASWAGASWAGASWAGASWAGASWAGASWAGASWAGASWA